MKIKIKNKKASSEIAKTISSFPVMLLIFIVLVIYLILTVTIYAAYAAKKVEGLSIPDFSEDIFNDFQFKEVEINNENISLINALINVKINEERIKEIVSLIGEDSSGGIMPEKKRRELMQEKAILGNYKPNLKDSIEKMVAKDSLQNKNEKICFILCPDCNEEYLKLSREFGNIDGMYLIYKNGEKTTNGLLSSYSDKVSKINLNLIINNKPNNLNLLYYYGECLK